MSATDFGDPHDIIHIPARGLILSGLTSNSEHAKPGRQ
jgi:hypothetical protein